MFFLNLSAGEFLTLLGALGALITALYLLDRARHRKIVSTLRFWVPAGSSEERQARKRMREPWSLILQLVSLLLLLMALAQVQWGSRDHAGRDHVVLVDTSSWSAERTGGETLLAQEKNIVRRYISLLPARDRVMLVEADSLATPLTAFTADRGGLLATFGQVSAGFSALNMDQVLVFAREAQRSSDGRRGEIVYTGPHLVNEGSLARTLTNFRVLPVTADQENYGIRQLAAKQIDDEDGWQASVRVKNYGSRAQAVHLRVHYGGTLFSPRTLFLRPDDEQSAEYAFTTKSAGELVADIDPGGSLRADDRASLHLPHPDTLTVAVYTGRSEMLKPLLSANHKLSATYFAPSEYVPKPKADLIVLDGFAPSLSPELPSLWINPPKIHSPLPVRNVVADATVTNWNSNDSFGADLRAKELTLPTAEIFETFEGDQAIASVEEGPVVVGRPPSAGHPGIAVAGFDPFAGELRYELTSPLLFARLLRWLQPNAFQTQEFVAERVGLAGVRLDSAEKGGLVRVTDGNGFAIPFTTYGDTLQVFVNRPSVVHIRSQERERILSLILPDVAEREWKVPANVAEGLPPTLPLAPQAIDLWKWFALLGAAGLLIEFLLFGNYGSRRRQRVVRRTPQSSPAKEESELVAK